jgi:hypothetical protein
MAAAAAALALVASRRPKGMATAGPPASATASRAARATMSAHDTTLGQSASSARFARSMMSSRRIPKLADASLSPSNPRLGTESNRMDASQAWPPQDPIR